MERSGRFRSFPVQPPPLTVFGHFRPRRAAPRLGVRRPLAARRTRDGAAPAPRERRGRGGATDFFRSAGRWARRKKSGVPPGAEFYRPRGRAGGASKRRDPEARRGRLRRASGRWQSHRADLPPRSGRRRLGATPRPFAAAHNGGAGEDGFPPPAVPCWWGRLGRGGPGGGNQGGGGGGTPVARPARPAQRDSTQRRHFAAESRPEGDGGKTAATKGKAHSGTCGGARRRAGARCKPPACDCTASCGQGAMRRGELREAPGNASGGTSAGALLGATAPMRLSQRPRDR